MSLAGAVLPSSESASEWPLLRSLPGRFSPAFALLLICCREAASADRDEHLRAIFSEAGRWAENDWAELVTLAEHHRVLPHVHAALHRVRAVPETIRQRLRSLALESARSSLWFTSEVLRIVRHLDHCGIPVLPYKGPLLAQLLFGDVTFRQFSDLDFLVRRADVLRARAALRELGYDCEQKLTARQERAHLASHYEHTFSSSGKRNLVELQWHVLPRFYAVDLEVTGFFDRSVAMEIAGASLRTLGADDLFLVLCVHAAKHAWNQLSLVVDIARLANRDQLDWGRIVAQAKRLRMERIVLANFWLARELCGTEVPQAFTSAVSSKLQAMLEIRVVALARGEALHPESPGYFRLMLQLREDWRDRMRFLWRLAFTPSSGEWSAITLPESLFPIYGVVRLFRLARRLVAEPGLVP